MLRLACLIILLCVAPLSAAQLTVDYQFKDLRGQTTSNLAHLHGKPVAMMFFEPECPWCIKQAIVLKKLHQECHKQVHPIALGVNGDNLSLKRALFRLNFPFEAYRPPSDLVQEMGGIPATPILLLLDENGVLIKGYRGYTAMGELKAQLCPTA